MPDWGTFAGFLAVLSTLLVLLARSSQRLLSDDGREERNETACESEPVGVASGSNQSLPLASPAHGESDTEPSPTPGSTTESETTQPQSNESESVQPPSNESESVQPPSNESESVQPPSNEPESLVGDFHPSRDFRLADGPVPPSRRVVRARSSPSTSIDFSTGELLANVALSHGLFGVLLLAAVGYTQVPLVALGVVIPTPDQVGVGIVFGVVLWLLSEGSARWFDVSGIERSEALREALAPDSLAGWLSLYLVALPLVAGFEELLFRGALIGALSVGFEVSPWLLAAGSSVLFAIGHGAQGPGGMVVTGVLGLVLAGGFIATGSLVVVLIAHYLVNALEFAVHELGPQLRQDREPATK